MKFDILVLSALLTSVQALSVGFPAIADNQVLFSLNDDNTCPIDIPLSCSNSTPIENSCCFESPGGILLQTQFWDYYPPIGPNDTFTLHGLWPDNCDGSYEQFCNDKLNIHDVTSIIKDEFKDDELYDKMTKVWKNFNGNDESLWIHEFNKHATCINTLSPSCYNTQKFTKNENVYDFFKITMNLYEKLPTFKFLADEGIVPSTDTTYTKEEISKALSKNFDGNEVYFKCNKYNALQEIWYYHHLQSSIMQQDFKPFPTILSSNCPSEGIKFLPKGGFKPPPHTPTPSPPGGGDKGYIKLPNHSGCLISNGQWYDYGTCATYQISKLQFGGYNLKSSKGYCGVTSDGEFNCNRSNQPSRYQFQFNKELKELGYGSKFNWCFDELKKHGNGKYVQIPIKLADDDGDCENPFKLKLT